MYKIKIVTAKNSDKMFRQLPNGQHFSKDGRYRFYVDEDVDSPDFVLVRNKGLKKKTVYHVAPENTILALSEPYSIVNFPKRYRDQFGMLCSCQPQLKHKHVIYTQALLPWFVGVNRTHSELDKKYEISYDTLKNSTFPKKNKLISVITSNKAFTKGHQERINFVEKLKAHYGEQLDVFGMGFNQFDDKWDVLAPYQYHIAIENNSTDYYWTEKLSDCFLAGTYPIYYGCKNIADYFPNRACSSIDIHDFAGAIKIIDSVIENHLSEKNRDALEISKQLVLDKYNLFDSIATYCDLLNPKAPKKDVELYPAVTMLDWHNFYLYIFSHSFFLLKNGLKRIIYGKPKL